MGGDGTGTKTKACVCRIVCRHDHHIEPQGLRNGANEVKGTVATKKLDRDSEGVWWSEKTDAALLAGTAAA